MSDPECTVCQNTSSPHGVPPVSGIPPYGAGRRDLTRPDEQRAAAPETTPGQALHDALRESAVAEFDMPIEAFQAWEDVRQSQRDRLEAAAQRVIAAAAPETPYVDALIAALNKKINEAEAERDDLRQQLDTAPPLGGPELAAAMREARLYREAITALVDWLKTSAAATHPSKKSAIEFELIRKLQKILEGK